MSLHRHEVNLRMGVVGSSAGKVETSREIATRTSTGNDLEYREHGCW